MAVEMADERFERWPTLVEHVAQLRREEFENVLAGLERLVRKSIPENLKEAVWGTLREIVRQHTRFRTAKWALPHADVTRLGSIRDKLAPHDLLTVQAPLF